MAAINVYTFFETTIDGVRVTGGSLTTPTAVTAASEVKHDQTFSIANGGTQELFDVDDDIGDFDFLWILSDQSDVLLEIVVDDDADNGESYQVKELFAGLPFILGSDDALASDGTVSAFTGTADLIERITVKNSSGSTAKVRVFAAT